MRRRLVQARNKALGVEQLERSIQTLGGALRTEFNRQPETVRFCPVCNQATAQFLPGPDGRPNAACPNCSSLERHRLLWLYLKLHTELGRQPLRLLHFAPEACLMARLAQLPQLDYVTADLSSARASVKTDIQALSFGPGSFDFVLCSHVLEHIPDDRKALRELYRVLRPHGRALINVPIRDAHDTLEDPRISTPEQRREHYGQSDHLRYYGRDFAARLAAAGFNVKEEHFWERFDPPLIHLFGLNQERLYLCQRA